MTGPELLDYMGVDAIKWASEFCQRARVYGLDEGWMAGWFANAIEQGREAGRRESRS